MYGGGDINEEWAAKKLLIIVPNKYTQIALLVKMLDLYELTIEHVRVASRLLTIAGLP